MTGNEWLKHCQAKEEEQVAKRDSEGSAELQGKIKMNFAYDEAEANSKHDAWVDGIEKRGGAELDKIAKGNKKADRGGR